MLLSRLDSGLQLRSFFLPAGFNLGILLYYLVAFPQKTLGHLALIVEAQARAALLLGRDAVVGNVAHDETKIRSILICATNYKRSFVIGGSKPLGTISC